jgi:hypothetical protein
MSHRKCSTDEEQTAISAYYLGKIVHRKKKEKTWRDDLLLCKTEEAKVVNAPSMIKYS